MAYSTQEDIQQDFPALTFDETSKVKLSDIPDFIDDADAVIDSYISGRYVTPVTSVPALAVLRMYSRSMVSDKISGMLQVKQATNQAANQNVRTGLGTKDVLKLLGDLRDGLSQLSGAQLAKDAGGISSFNVKTCRKPEFRKDEKKW